jgi:hypothetical protein
LEVEEEKKSAEEGGVGGEEEEAEGKELEERRGRRKKVSQTRANKWSYRLVGCLEEFFFKKKLKSVICVFCPQRSP